MPRPICCRRVAASPPRGLFKPAGVRCADLEEVVLSVDELEALRLADLEGLYQEQAAGLMNVSRQTFGRIVESARKKVAEMLVKGKALRIEGGVIEMARMRKFQCAQCQQEWEVPFGGGRPVRCPGCGGADVHRHPDDRGGRGCQGGRGGGPGRGRGRCLHGGRAHGPISTDNPQDQ
ncbi:MAG: DUF134 domain-containing protein [Planctomycetota bacterium]|nr:DUF134 domain-containing protein [Planctomycetota bacterium]